MVDQQPDARRGLVFKLRKTSLESQVQTLTQRLDEASRNSV